MIETTDKRDTSALVLLIQAEISRRIAGARVDTVTTVVTLREKPPARDRRLLRIVPLSPSS
jgi:hypothetical protein